MWILSAFLVGFLGSFHCVGMCGPIALALPSGNATAHQRIIGKLFYHSGRIITYACFGLAAGALGHVIAAAGFQRALSIFSGMTILVMVLLPMVMKGFSPETILYRWTGFVKREFRKWMGSRGNVALFSIGAINGLLPCGFVYLAIAAASTTTTWLNGGMYMLLFGLGTTPAMLLLSMSGIWMGPGIRKSITRWSPYIAVAVALFLIYRGLYVMPVSCCRNH